MSLQGSPGPWRAARILVAVCAWASPASGLVAHPRNHRRQPTALTSSPSSFGVVGCGAAVTAGSGGVRRVAAARRGAAGAVWGGRRTTAAATWMAAEAPAGTEDVDGGASISAAGGGGAAAAAAVPSSNAGGVEAGAVAGEGLKGALTAIYKFTRPHTIRGTILASVMGVARVLSEVVTDGTFSAIAWANLLPTAACGMLALLLGNAFIVGINQIYDVDIDRVNKPFLPVAAAELSVKRAWLIVAGSLVGGHLIVQRLFSPLIFKLYAFGAFIGGLYSIPPFRFKQYPIVAGLTIATVRGFLLNFGVYYAAREALGLPFAWSPAVAFLVRFNTIFGLTIAVTKDLPDVEGDKQNSIETFSTRLGVKKVAAAATAVLFLNYAGAVATALLAQPGAYRRGFMAAAHGGLGLWLLASYRKLQPDSQLSIKKFYKRIWDLFYLEYLMYPFI